MLVYKLLCSTLLAMSRWGDEKTLYFIQLYRQGECLWNTRSPLYKNKIAREHAYRDILRVFNDRLLDVRGVKNKIKNLRSVYHTELKKVRDSLRCGSDEQVYRPTLSWFHEMHAFLGDMIEDRAEPVLGNLNVEPVESAEDETATTQEQSPDVEHMTIEGTLEPNSDPLQDIKSEEPSNDSYEEDVELDDLRLSNPPSSSGLQSTRKQKRVINRRKRPYESEFSDVIQRLESTVSQVVNSTSNRPEVSVQSEDEFHIFALSVAAQLRQLPLHVAITTQSKIQSMLSEARLASIFLNSSSQPSISTVKTEQASDE